MKAFFENLEDGARVDDFAEWFPGVARHQVEAVVLSTTSWPKPNEKTELILSEANNICTGQYLEIQWDAGK